MDREACLLAALVAVGGATGAAARWALSTVVPPGPGDLPAATLAANLAGALALGLLVGALPRAARLRALLGSGLLGGFTTASTLALEVDRLLVRAPAVALAYLSVTTAGGLALAAVGLCLGRGLRGRGLRGRGLRGRGLRGRGLRGRGLRGRARARRPGAAP